MSGKHAVQQCIANGRPGAALCDKAILLNPCSCWLANHVQAKLSNPIPTIDASVGLGLRHGRRMNRAIFMHCPPLHDSLVPQMPLHERKPQAVVFGEFLT